MSEWMLFNTNWAIYQLRFDVMIMMLAVYNTLSVDLLVLDHPNNSPRVNILLHSMTLSWLWANAVY